MPWSLLLTATNLLCVRQVVFPLFINSALGELISSTSEISLLGTQAINTGTASQELCRGGLRGMLQLLKQCSLCVGVSFRLRQAIKPLHWKVVVIFHQFFFFFLIEKNGFDLLEKELCGELLLWFSFSAFLLFGNQNNFTFISRKKKHKCRKDESRMGIVIFALLRFRNWPSGFCLFS